MSHPVPMDEGKLLNPTYAEAMATAGCLLHWVACDPGRVAQFAAAMEHCPGDLPPDLVARVLEATHRLLEPECPFPAATSLADLG